MKSEVCRRKVDTWDKQLDRIMDAIARIKERQDEPRRAIRHVLTRVAKCIDGDGGIFEMLLSTNKYVTLTINIRNST
jgi:hypothetical protein